MDGHGRRIEDLRVSVTDRCNFRCQYCMPAEGLPWLDRAEILSFEEIERVVALTASMGVGAVRLTGGEPLVRRHFPDLVRRLAAVDGVHDLSLTTNGYLLERDADALVSAGLKRVNVSIDSLQRDRFFQMTRRDSLPQVLRGLEALALHPQVHPIKVNAVAVRGFTEEEAVPFAEFARSTAFQVRFIEFMPLDADRSWRPEAVLTGEELRRIIHAVHPLEEVPREPSATARVFRFADGAGEIGFINPVSEPFCDDCNRIRLTAEGTLRTCLFSQHETDLRGPLRDGASDNELEALVRDAVWRKELKHRVNVSIDSLQRDRFFEMTRRDSLPQVLRGLEALSRFASVHPIKVNAVAMRDFTEAEAVPFAEFARSTAFQVRFIEWMPLDGDRSWTADRVLPGDALRRIIHAVYPLEELPREPSATARVFRFTDGRGEIGFINPVSEPFCDDCNRIRLTAEGRLRTCLFSERETDLRAPLRDGASNAEIEEIVREAVWNKELKHHVNDPGFRPPARTMSAIGG